MRGDGEKMSDVSVTGRMDLTLADLERRCLILLDEEQRKIAPNNALISVLCNTIRLIREVVGQCSIRAETEVKP